MPETRSKIVIVHHLKSKKLPFAIYKDTLLSLLKKIQDCDKYSTNLFASKIKKHFACDFLLLTHCLFVNKKRNIMFTEASTLWKLFVQI